MEERRKEKTVKTSHRCSMLCLLFLVTLILPVFCSPQNALRASTSGSVFSIKGSDGKSVQASFSSIQQAINDAANGSTIEVPSGIYPERILINKTINLVGENVSSTIIDGGNAGTVVQIEASNVNISNFTIQNSGWGWTNNGIYVHNADRVKIENNIFPVNCHNIRLNYSMGTQIIGNIIEGNGYGIRLVNSDNCMITDNKVSNCIGGVHLELANNCTVKRNVFTKNNQGIRFYSPCTYNTLTENIVLNNTYDGMIDDTMNGNSTFQGNTLFHNDFINNTYPFILKGVGFTWYANYPLGGNYWDRHDVPDQKRGPYQNETGSDGIVDTAYVIDSSNVDLYPLVKPFNSLPVHNLNTGKGYATVQEAIDAPETLNGHNLSVDEGEYHERINVYKAISIIGEGAFTTIIDGDNIGTVLSVAADNVTITGFTVRNSGSYYPPYGMDCGILLNNTSHCTIANNSVTENRVGIYLFYATNTTVSGNAIYSNDEDGLWLYYSGNNTITQNDISDNHFNFGVFGSYTSDFHNTVDQTNTVNRRSIQYMINAEDRIIDSHTDAGTVYLINCLNITLKDLNLANNGCGVFCYNTTGSTIENVTTSENNYGIYIQESTRNTVANSLCSDNWVNICLEGASENRVKNNTAINGEKGISLYEANNNTLEGNTIQNTLYGIRLFSSNFNRIYHNNLIKNTEQADLIHSFENSWDNGFEGNYWNDYNGTDSDRDGIGDSPLTFDSANTDHYPLLGVFHSFSILNQQTLGLVDVITNSTFIGLAYEESTHTLKLSVNNSDSAVEFFRVCVPHTLVQPELTIVIDSGQAEPLYVNYSLYDNGISRWIYFSYETSAHEVLIIPESWPILLLLLSISIAISFSAKNESNLRTSRIAGRGATAKHHKSKTNNGR